MWNTTGVPLRLVLLVAGVVLLFSQLGSIRFWRYLDDATTPGTEHAGLTRQEAVSGAVARVGGYLRVHRLPGGRISLVRAEPIDGRVQWWCKGCVHWQVELALREERFCIALTEEFSAFSNGCSRWHPRSAPPPAELVAAAGQVRVQTPPAGSGLVLQRQAVYVMRADGRELRRLVSQPHDLALSWSPDGTRVAWVGNTERNFGIHATTVSSGRTVRLTRHEGDHAPDWR